MSIKIAHNYCRSKRIHVQREKVKKIMVGFAMCTMVNIKDMQDLLTKYKVNYHGLNRGHRVSLRSVINNRKGTCQIMSDKDSNAHSVQVSKSG